MFTVSINKIGHNFEIEVFTKEDLSIINCLEIQKILNQIGSQLTDTKLKKEIKKHIVKGKKDE